MSCELTMGVNQRYYYHTDISLMHERRMLEGKK